MNNHTHRDNTMELTWAKNRSVTIGILLLLKCSMCWMVLKGCHTRVLKNASLWCFVCHTSQELKMQVNGRCRQRARRKEVYVQLGRRRRALGCDGQPRWRPKGTLMLKESGAMWNRCLEKGTDNYVRGLRLRYGDQPKCLGRIQSNKQPIIRS